MRKLTPKLLFPLRLWEARWELEICKVDGSSLMAMPASLETLTVVPQEEYARVTGVRDFPLRQVKFLLTTMEKQTVRLWRFITRLPGERMAEKLSVCGR